MNISDIEQQAYDISEKLDFDQMTVLMTFFRLIQHGRTLQQVTTPAKRPVSHAPEDEPEQPDDEPPFEEEPPEPPRRPVPPAKRATRGRPARGKAAVVDDPNVF
jgi:hypothetical protein